MVETEYTLNKFADNTKLGRVVDGPDGCAAIQKDLDRLEKWANRKLIKFNKGNAKSCSWGGMTPCTSTHWELTRWKAALQKNILRSLEDSKLNTHQQCALAAKKVNSLLCQQVKGDDRSLLGTGEKHLVC